MSESTYRFRSSLGGFHKGDVTAYIEKTAAQHRSELLEYERQIAELQGENRSLQQQLNLLMMSTPAPAPAPEPEPEPAKQPAPVPATITPEEATDWMHLELQAYRRAEAVERHANVRAKELYEKMEDLCGGALDDFQAADEAVKQTIEVMMAQAASLEKAYQVLSAALNASRDKIASINSSYPLPEDLD